MKKYGPVLASLVLIASAGAASEAERAVAANSKTDFITGS